LPGNWLSGMAMALDYYDILGVPPKADAGEIKKAYRLLALRWHPDRNPGDPWATNRFLRLGEAYRVLIDPARRAAYDWLRSQERQPGTGRSRSRRQHLRAAGGTPPSPGSRRSPRPSSSGRQTSRNSGRSRGRERPSPSPFLAKEKNHNHSEGHYPWLLSFKDLPHRLISWLTGRLPADLEWEMVPTPDQPDLIMDLKLPRWLAARGARINFLIKSNDQQRRVKIAIPAGVKDGTCLRVRGGGKDVGMRQGHLYINIRIKA
jgi:DnaJ-class molecular chaperone